MEFSFILFGPLERFQNCCTAEPQLLSDIFLKKIAHFTTLKRAREFWDRYKL